MPDKKRTRKVKSKSRASMGRILPPVDITNVNQLGELDKRINAGPLTLVFVYAPWCGHCTKYKPNMTELENMPNRSVQSVRIRDDVFPKSSINKTPLEGYPSLLLIKPQNEAISFSKENGEVTPVIPEHNNMSNMKTIVSTVGTPEGMLALSSNSQQTPLSTDGLIPVVSTANTNAVNSLIPVSSIKNKNNYFKNNLSNSTPERTKSPLGNSTIIYTPLEKSASPSPPDLSLDRLSANMLQSEQRMVEQASSPLSQEGGPRKPTQSGGNLMNLLSRVAYQYGPAAALLYMANVKAASSKKTKKANKTRRA
jgi:thiol-disulfide isomerase/thioredoxin